MLLIYEPKEHHLAHMSQATVFVDGRGRYDRSQSNVQKRLSLAQLAWNHHMKIESGQLKECSKMCPFGGRCFKGLSENDLLSCHNKSFGTSLAWDEKRAKPTIQQSTAETQGAWRSVMSYIFSFDGQGQLARDNIFTVANVRVCEECMRQAFGIPRSTWNKYIQIGRSSPRALEMYEACNEWAKSERSEKRRDQRIGTKHSEAMTWWLDWLSW